MRLKQIMAVVIVVFCVIVLYFLAAGYIFNKPTSSQAKMQERQKMHALQGPQSPPILH